MVTRLPVRVLARRSHGWRDRAVGVGGGGLPPGTALLRFDGWRYPATRWCRQRSRSRAPPVRVAIAADAPLVPLAGASPRFARPERAR